MGAAKRILATLCALAVALSSALAADVIEGEARIRAKRRGSEATLAGGADGTSGIKDLADIGVDAVAQGPVAISGVATKGEAASITRGMPAAGRITNGAPVEREIGFALANSKSVRLALRYRDVTTARRIAAVANTILGARVAEPLNSANLRQGFEALLLLQRFSTMFSSLGQVGPLGDGAPGIDRLLLAEEYGRTEAAAGSIGLADTIARELLSLQEFPSS